MKRQFTFIFALFFLCSASYSQQKDSGDLTISTKKASEAAVKAISLQTPTNLTGTGLQVSGLSTSPKDITFSWTDNSVGENGYRFQRKVAGIYWNFGCETGPDTETITHHLSFFPGETEQFRLFSFSGSGLFEKRSGYAYVTVEMARPDLIITNQSISKTTTIIGEQITASCSVENIGTYRSASTTVMVYLLAEGNITSLGTIPVNPLDTMQASGVLTTTIEIPSSYTGEYQIGFKVDPNESIKELNNNNNVVFTPITIIGPDLQVTSKVISKTSVMPGETITTTYSVSNTGNAPAGESRLKIYLSTSSTGTTRELVSQAIPSLNPGEVLSFSNSITIPTGTSYGSYYIVFLADATSGITESNENNTVSLAITVNQGPKPDLIIESGSISGSGVYTGSDAIQYPSASGNEWITVNTLVKNNGTANSPSTFVTYYFSTNNSIDNNDYNLNFSNTVPALNVGANVSINTQILLPVKNISDVQFPTGWYYIIQAVDEGNSIDELNNNNNTYAAKMFYYGGGSGKGEIMLEKKPENSMSENITVSPNPTDGLIKINYQGPEFSEIFVEIFNSTGELILAKKIMSLNDEYIDISDQPKGIYLVRTRNSNNTWTTKIILE